MERSSNAKAFLFSLLAVLSLNGSVWAQIDSTLAANLQTIMNNRVQVNGNHGVSACVIMPDGAIWKGTAGVGVGNAAITDSTVFHGASITKANIATLIMMLAQDSLLSLDSTWDHYVSLNVNFDSTITIRQLLNHTSGIADYLETPATEGYVTNDFNHAFTPTEILETIVPGTPLFAPGTNFAYSSSNYALAALIVEAVTGHTVQQELHDRIWGPLGMTHTYFGGFEPYSEPRAGVWWNFGSGTVNYSNDPETSMLTYGYGGANIVSTPEDLAHFARALFVDSLVSPASLTEMKVFDPQSYPSWCRGYGLGIHNASAFGNNTVLGHDGYYTNMADMFHSYDDGFTLVTMTNTQGQWVGIFNAMYNAIRSHLSVDIEEPAPKIAVQLSPNPASDRLRIDWGMEAEEVHVAVLDLNGKALIEKHEVNSTHSELLMQGLAPGIYAVIVQIGEDRISARLVVEH